MAGRKIIVLGDGFVGRAFRDRGYQNTSRRDYEWVRSAPHLSKFARLVETYDVVINTIAFTDTKKAQEEPAAAFETNVAFPEFLSEACRYLNKKLVHVSTGCVYQPFPYLDKWGMKESVHSVYTITKLLGESALDPDRDIIIRPRLIFGRLPHKSNLFNKLSHFNQFPLEQNSMTSTDTIVEAVEALIEANANGVYNVVNRGHASMMDVAAILKVSPREVLAISDLEKKNLLTSPNILLSSEKLEEYYRPRFLHEELTTCADKWRFGV